MQKFFKSALTIALVGFLFAGCSSTPTQEQGAAVEERNPATSPPSGAATTGSGTGTISGTANPNAGANANSAAALRDPNNILSKRGVYFDYDSFVVKDEYKPLVQAHARYLQANPSARMTIQGNTDERGSREYNIALAQKRADAVKRMMQLLGAGDAQIETVSFGKEKPRNEGHDEAAWAENRRDDIVYAGE